MNYSGRILYSWQSDIKNYLELFEVRSVLGSDSWIFPISVHTWSRTVLYPSLLKISIIRAVHRRADEWWIGIVHFIQALHVTFLSFNGSFSVSVPHFFERNSMQFHFFLRPVHHCFQRNKSIVFYTRLWAWLNL